ncbi:MAG: tRNA (cytidine(56)-2'-O)-methyltransferase [Thaumarchaeota archaeon]|nr:tRNA (cytidine(56)-2'-O)-methyltransferase [Nitrososphaerota archaeon]
MRIEVLRIGQRLVRDDRVTTHVALISRAFGASKILMYDANPEIKDTLSKVNRTWGGDFEVEIIDNWRRMLRSKKSESYRIVHLTMYGESINDVEEKIRKEDKILAVIGAEKVPREVYDMADYNVAIGSQPHSEIAALAVLLDRLFEGRQFQKKFKRAQREIIPTGKGKRVMDKSTA